MVMIIENNDWDNLEDWRYYKQLFRDNGIILDDENQINEEKRNFILEKIKKNNKVECDNCEHTWDLSDGGKDKYMCHKCGHDNEPDKDETAKWIKCRNCNKRFTQTVVKKKKSTPLCPYCKSMN
jgi:DNA-directed RNA polymerase subunit RPC12/RpoP